MALTNLTPNTIAVDAGSDTKYIEAIAGESMLPGNLVYFDESVSTVPTLMKSISAVDGAQQYLLVVTENTPEGQGVDDAYGVGDTVYARHFRAGDLFRIRWETTSGFNYGEAAGQLLTPLTPAGEVRDVSGPDEAICYTAQYDAGGAASRLVTVFAK